MANESLLTHQISVPTLTENELNSYLLDTQIVLRKYSGDAYALDGSIMDEQSDYDEFNAKDFFITMHQGVTYLKYWTHKAFTDVSIATQTI